MNPRLKQFLQVFYRLAQIEMLGEMQIYVAITIKSLLTKKVAHPMIDLKTLKNSLPDLSDDQVMTILHELAEKKYLNIREGKITFSKFFLNQVLHG